MKRYLFCLVCLWMVGVVGCAKKVETKTTTVTHTDTVTKTTPEKIVTVPHTVTVNAAPPPVKKRRPVPKKTSSPPVYRCTTVREQKICDIYVVRSDLNGPGLARYGACAPRPVQYAVPVAVGDSPTSDVIVWCAK